MPQITGPRQRILLPLAIETKQDILKVKSYSEFVEVTITIGKNLGKPVTNFSKAIFKDGYLSLYIMRKHFL